jgi:MoaD family protein
MDITVEYLGQVRVIAGRKSEVVDVSADATVKVLLQKLSTRYGEAFDKEVFQDGQNPRDDLVVAVNGTAILQLDYLATRLKLKDTVTLFPIFPGGG